METIKREFSTEFGWVVYIARRFSNRIMYENHKLLFDSFFRIPILSKLVQSKFFLSPKWYKTVVNKLNFINEMIWKRNILRYYKQRKHNIENIVRTNCSSCSLNVTWSKFSRIYKPSDTTREICAQLSKTWINDVLNKCGGRG